ncbi:MAG: eukaryotic-like serine/threonine-protein kinase [Blastocatellia bacterium]|jgi:serine/threonine protein kinase|nr:eukaryotic-like serine/threonine-protein kinase [Blastocatellia bacterium]
MPNDEKSTAGTALLAPATILQSRYRVTGHLGQGGMGAVYEAIDLRLGHTVALKQTLTNNEDQWKQFEREARLLAWLNHPALPRVSDYFTEGHRAFFVMQFVEGQDLAEIIAQQPGPLPRQAVVAWADQLLDALIYLHTHERQIIHRDIKPHNLKITARGQIVLLDFGLAKTQTADSSGDISCTSVFGYTPRYAPLEQIQDLGTSPQSDIYALGATLYHLLTGVKPPDALARATALVSARPNPLKPADEIVAAVGVELAAILTRAMAQNPNDRYATAVEFREALRQIGRVENEDIEYVKRIEEPELPVATNDPSVADTMDLVTTGKGGSHALAAICVILLAAFAVFCSYYPWKIPSAIPPHATSTNGIALSSAAPARVKIDRRFRDQKSAASGASFDVRSSALKRGNKTAARS